MSFESTAIGALDYAPCRYGNSKLLFRGPRRDLTKPYISFLGGSETYGKFVEKPFVDLLDMTVEPSCVNFGCQNSGVDVFLNDPFLSDAAQRGRLTVLQVPTAQNMSNRLFTVHPRRNDRFLSATQLLRALYPDVDFATFNFNKHMLLHLSEQSEERFALVRQELHQAWSARMRTLLERITGQVILTWISHKAPSEEEDHTHEPWYVTPGMINDIREQVTQYVEIVLPIGDETADMVFPETEALAAQETLGPQAHSTIANALRPVIEKYC
jgi:hypothetical protein